MSQATRSERAQRWGWLAAAAVLLVLASIAGVAVGARTVPIGDIWPALVGSASTNDALVVREVRLPRTIAAIGVGAALAVSGALIQTLTSNPLAEPGLLGVTTGAGFAITMGAVLGLAPGQGAQLVCALVGSVLAAVLVYAVGRTAPLRLILAGVALTFLLAGLSLGLRLMLPTVFDVVRFWSVGSLAGREQAPLVLPLTVIALGLVGSLLVSRHLGAVALGEDVAQALGVNVTATRLVVLMLITGLAATATAVAGPIAFVGLMIPHLARRLGGVSIGWLIGYSIVLGATLLVIADVLARVLLPTGEMPVAIVTAFLGAPVLIWAVRRYGTVGP